MGFSTMNDFDKLGFFLAGLFNNASFVIMIAGAKNIAPSMVGLVYVSKYYSQGSTVYVT